MMSIRFAVRAKFRYRIMKSKNFLEDQKVYAVEFFVSFRMMHFLFYHCINVHNPAKARDCQAHNLGSMVCLLVKCTTKCDFP